MRDLIILEYSKKQDAFHRSSLIEMIKSNLTTLSAGKNSDYVPVAVFIDEDEYNDRCPIYKNLIRKFVEKENSTELSSLTIEELLK